MKRELTRTSQLPAGQSTRRFPRARSDRQQQIALTYLVSPRHQESPPSETHVSRRPSSRQRKGDGSRCCCCCLLLSLSLSLSLSSVSFRSRSHSFLRALLSRFLSHPAVRPSVRPSVGPSVVRSFTRRPTAHSTPGTKKGDKQRAFDKTRVSGSRYTYIHDTRHFRLTPCLATTSFSSPQADAGRHARKIRPRDSHTLRAARTHNARTRFVMAIFGGKQLRAPTARRGSLRRPASGTSLRDSATGAPFSTGLRRRRRTYPSFLPSVTRKPHTLCTLRDDNDYQLPRSRQHSRELALALS